ncbi:MAG TPA: AMP-binding protein [Gemmataceae bacterium]|jgi:long-chain-fatty-acid--[acyl-carrier-protein] ligase|nr:AMP-binding protein [Gemmataceae bacterium]
MLRLVRDIFWAWVRLILALRYRVRVQGLEQLRGLKRPVLVLPNHPAYIDPPLVLSALWPILRPRPLIYEGFFRNPGYFQTPFNSSLIKLLDALLVPDLTSPSAKARARAEQVLREISEGLRKGGDYILWPAGHIQRDGAERLRAARALTDILNAAPQATLVRIRTRGVWGSMFSYGRTGNRPHIMSRLWAGAGWLLSNLLLFMPRRNVDITVEVVDRGRLPPLDRQEINPWFEEWYNADKNGAPEQPTFIPYHFLIGPRTYQFPPPATSAAADLSRVRPETRAEVAAILERKLKRPLTEDERRPDTRLDTLGLDSLAIMGVVLDIEQRFGYFSEQPPQTVADLLLLAEGLVESKPAQPPPRAWFRKRNRPAALHIEGETLAEAFVHRALANRKAVVAADDQAGVLTYERLLVGTLTLARRFAEQPGTNVGLLLPASVACDTAFLALQLAGKVPVMLNWTTGPTNLAHAVRTVGLKCVVTSNRFTDRLDEKVVQAMTPEGVQLLCLEDMHQGISRFEFLRTWLTIRFRPGQVRRLLPRVSPAANALILFTSGSEKEPKTVPLTHGNLLSNQRAALEVLDLNRDDAVLGFLPAFHSFGLAVTSLLPLLAGVRVVHHPDPTAASTLARKIDAYKPTILAGTPTFVGAILGRAKPEQLQSLRLIYVGAEKCPEALMAKCREVAPGARLLEGYGITECSPVVAVNRPTANRPGTVGQALPGVEACVVADETDMRELWVSAPSVFPGYLAYEEKQPFRQRDGKRWYVTGDYAEIDADGFIRLCGRKKRFLKAGGEMISLEALEEPFARRYPPVERGPRVAVEGIETEDGRRIVLFSTEPVSLRDANDLLQEEGFRGVMRLDDVRQVREIPVLGTGKADYKALRPLVLAPNQPMEIGSA